jgi:hypothetical protein
MAEHLTFEKFLENEKTSTVQEELVLTQEAHELKEGLTEEEFLKKYNKTMNLGADPYQFGRMIPEHEKKSTFFFETNVTYRPEDVTSINSCIKTFTDRRDIFENDLLAGTVRQNTFVPKTTNVRTSDHLEVLELPVDIDKKHLEAVKNACRTRGRSVRNINRDLSAIDYGSTKFDNASSAIKYTNTFIFKQTIAHLFKSFLKPAVLIVSEGEESALKKKFFSCLSDPQVTVISTKNPIEEHRIKKYDLIYINYSYCYGNAYNIPWHRYLKPSGYLFIPTLTDTQVSDKNYEITPRTFSPMVSFYEVQHIGGKSILMPIFTQQYYKVLACEKRFYDVHNFDGSEQTLYVQVQKFPQQNDSLCGLMIVHDMFDKELISVPFFDYPLDKFKPHSAERMNFHPLNFDAKDLYYFTKQQHVFCTPKSDGLPICVSSIGGKFIVSLHYDATRHYQISTPAPNLPEFRLYGEVIGDVSVGINVNRVKFYDFDHYLKHPVARMTNGYRLLVMREIFDGIVFTVLNTIVTTPDTVFYPMHRPGILGSVKTIDSYSNSVYPSCKKLKGCVDYTIAPGVDIMLSTILVRNTQYAYECSLLNRPGKKVQEYDHLNNMSLTIILDYFLQQSPFCDTAFKVIASYILRTSRNVSVDFKISQKHVGVFFDSSVFNKLPKTRYKDYPVDRLFAFFFGIAFENEKIPILRDNVYADYHEINPDEPPQHYAFKMVCKGGTFYYGTALRTFFSYTDHMRLLYDLLTYVMLHEVVEHI